MVNVILYKLTFLKVKNLMFNLSNKLTRISGDFAINILASVIYTFARQIVVFPMLAARLTDADYGTLLTVAGLANVCTAMVGNALNNIRLIQNSKYDEQGVCGDFNLLCAIGCGASVIFAIVLQRLFSLPLMTTGFLALYLCVSNFYQYATAFYRLTLDFKKVFLCNCVVSVAYIAATFVFATATLWPAVFLVGEGVGLIFVSCTTPLLREPLAKTPLLSDTGKMFLVFFAMNLISNLLMYADRMIIYPILGAESVSYYSTASFFGKSAGIVMTPISSVLLGYYAQKDFKASKKLFALVNGISLAALAVFLLGCVVIGPWFTRLLYPSLYEQSAPYLFLANLAAVIQTAGNMANPMILKCCPTRYMLFVTIFHSAAYLLFTFLWMPMFGLYGFCYAAVAANTVRLLTLYIIGLRKF